MKQLHEIKLRSEYFDSVACGDKNFEIRFNDRGYQKGDLLIMTEYHETDYCSRKIKAVIGYVTAYQQKEGFVVFSLIDVKVMK